MCKSNASIDDSSFDPDGDPITLSQAPMGPYVLGATSVTLTVTDDKGVSDACTATVTVTDTSPPSIVVLNPVVEVFQSGPLTPVDVLTLSGFSTFDNCGGSPTTGVTPPSPYPPGETTVMVTSTDNNANSGSVPVLVRVLTAQDISQRAIEAVEDLVAAGSLTQGQGKSLIKKLEAAIDKLNQGKTQPACNKLKGFY